MAKKISYQKNVYTKFFDVAPGVWGMKDTFVNLYMVVNPFEGNWVLIDAGLKWSAPKIRKMAKQLFGENSRPSAIILTHGHFDHIGSVEALADEWDVPVYCHYLEMPYITGKSSYPPPDSTVGGGLMASMAWMYPKSPINIWSRATVLPGDGRIPGLPEWRYIHTPGHTPGHVSLYRERDGVLIAGDAFVTTKQESMINSIFLSKKKLHGPPAYFTPDWLAAEKSVKKLADLAPEVVATGHGKVMAGPDMRRELYVLSRHFSEQAIPSHGRYVKEPAVADATGVLFVPSKKTDYSLIGKLTAVIALGAIVIAALRLRKHYHDRELEVLTYETF
jgi:glyoxylase-like metal-dependent hydrolase (beta-lactamase superfamily II)